jgi:hypothetical protein
MNIFLQRLISTILGEHSMEGTHIIHVSPEKIQILGNTMAQPESKSGSAR